MKLRGLLATLVVLSLLVVLSNLSVAASDSRTVCKMTCFEAYKKDMPYCVYLGTMLKDEESQACIAQTQNKLTECNSACQMVVDSPFQRGLSCASSCKATYNSGVAKCRSSCGSNADAEGCTIGCIQSRYNEMTDCKRSCQRSQFKTDPTSCAACTSAYGTCTTDCTKDDPVKVPQCYDGCVATMDECTKACTSSSSAAMVIPVPLETISEATTAAKPMAVASTGCWDNNQHYTLYTCKDACIYCQFTRCADAAKGFFGADDEKMAACERQRLECQHTCALNHSDEQQAQLALPTVTSGQVDAAPPTMNVGCDASCISSCNTAWQQCLENGRIPAVCHLLQRQCSAKCGACSGFGEVSKLSVSRSGPALSGSASLLTIQFFNPDPSLAGPPTFGASCTYDLQQGQPVLTKLGECRDGNTFLYNKYGTLKMIIGINSATQQYYIQLFSDRYCHGSPTEEWNIFWINDCAGHLSNNRIELSYILKPLD